MPPYSRRTSASIRASSTTVKRSSASWRSSKRSKKRSISVVWQSLDNARGAKGTVRGAFLAVLSRPPSAAERAMWERDVARGKLSTTQDLVWTLVNSHEFQFIQ